MTQQLPPTEVWYCWKEFLPVPAIVVGQPDGPPRLLTPWADPFQYESPMDWLFETPEKAKEEKAEIAPNENWVLVKMTLEPVEIVNAIPDDEA